MMSVWRIPPDHPPQVGLFGQVGSGGAERAWFAGGRLAVKSGQGEAEGRALSRLCHGLDPAAVALNDALHRGQADAQARELVLVVKALEWLEQALGIGHVEARAVIGNPQPARAALLDRA